jgi:hypothetical protein
MLANLSSRDLKCLPNKPVVETITIIHCARSTVNNYLRICQIHQLWECEKSAVTRVYAQSFATTSSKDKILRPVRYGK